MKIAHLRLKKYPFSDVSVCVENQKGEILHRLDKNRTHLQKIYDAYTLTKGAGGTLRIYVDNQMKFEEHLLPSKSSRHKKKKNKKAETEIKEEGLMTFA